MLADTGLTFREIVMNDPLPKGMIQQAVFDFLNGREDAAIFGAMAVNAYVDERRMTEDVDIASARAEALAEELREYLNERLHIAVRVRTVRGGLGFRLYQLAKPTNRHLADVRPVDALPPTERIDGILVVTPVEVISGKVISCVHGKESRSRLPIGATSPICCSAFRSSKLKTVQFELGSKLRAQTTKSWPSGAKLSPRIFFPRKTTKSLRRLRVAVGHRRHSKPACQPWKISERSSTVLSR